MSENLESKGNFVEKGVKSFGELVGLFDSKPRAFATVGMIIIILYLWVANDNKNDRLLEQEERHKNEMIAEVRKQIKPLRDDLTKKSDSTKAVVDSTRSELAPVIKSIKETVKKINGKN